MDWKFGKPRFKYGDHIIYEEWDECSQKLNTEKGRIAGIKMMKHKFTNKITYAIIKDNEWKKEELGCHSDWEYYEKEGTTNYHLIWIDEEYIRKHEGL